MARKRHKVKSRITTLARKKTRENRARMREKYPGLQAHTKNKKAKELMEDIYWPDKIDVVRAIAAQGLDDMEMAKFLGVKPELYESWKAYYPTFARAIDDGRTHPDAEVLAALYKNAVGYDYETDEVVRTRHGGEVLRVTKRFPGETQAQKFWLQNRQKPLWNAPSTVQLTGQKGAAPIEIKQETKNDVINSILNMIKPRPDNE